MVKNSPLKIIAVESDTNVCFRLEYLLSQQHDMRLLGCAHSCREAKSFCADYPFQMLLVDLALPDGLGLELIREIASNHTDVDIMVLANSNDDPHIVNAIETGAKGYVLKKET